MTTADMQDIAGAIAKVARYYYNQGGVQ